MPTITIQPEHVAGLRYMFDMEFERVCDEAVRGGDIDSLRDFIAFGDQFGWEKDDPTPSEVTLSDALLQKLVESARGFASSIMADVYSERAGGPQVLTSPKHEERQARSLFAFAECHQAPEEVTA